MTWNPLQLRGLSFNSSYKSPSALAGIIHEGEEEKRESSENRLPI